MRNKIRTKKPAQPGGETRKPRRRREKSSSQEAPSTPKSPQYTARQREQMRKGLRILARVIVRAHLRKQAELADSQ